MTKLFKSIALFAFLMTNVIGFGQLDASFFSNPAISNGQISVCQGSTVMFNLTSPTAPNLNAATTVQWTFVGANIATSSSQGPLPVIFNSSGSAKLKLTKVTPTGTLTDSMSVIVNVSSNVITPTLTLSTPSLFTSSTLNGVSIFKNCYSINNTTCEIC